MKSWLPKAVHLPLFAAGACAIALGFLTYSADPMAEWIHASYRGYSAIAAATGPEAGVDPNPESIAAQANPRRRGKCSECGIVESAKLKESGSRVVYEITVRLQDRSTRVFNDSDATKWRPGERIILIGGGTPPRI